VLRPRGRVVLSVRFGNTEVACFLELVSRLQRTVLGYFVEQDCSLGDCVVRVSDGWWIFRMIDDGKGWVGACQDVSV
jgi:hypothetical protein